MARRIETKRIVRRRPGNNLTGIILVCGTLLVGALILRKGSERPEVRVAPVVAQFDTIQVPVLAQAVPAGTKVKEMQIITTAFPRHQLPDGVLLTLDEVKDGVSATALPQGLPLHRTNFNVNGVINPVIDQIPQGMRAMTLRVDVQSAVEGWAGSGSVVDILLVEKDRTSVIAEKVKVLSAERSVSPVNNVAAPNVPTTVTVLVTQEQCLAINTAMPMGRIAFALRNQEDQGSWDETSYNSQNLRGVAKNVETKSVVSGYVSYKEKKGESSFALADGKWVRTEVKPEGFFAADHQESESAKRVE